MPKPKICFYVPFYPQIKGGAEYQTKIIAVNLQKRGYEIVYISGGHDKNNCVYEDGFKIYQLPITSSLYAKATLYKAHIKEVCNIITKENPEIIYQRILNTFTYRLSLFSRKSRIPFILHIADNYSVTFQKGQKGKVKKMLFQKILANGPQIICQTEFQKQKVQDVGGKPVAVIPNMHPVLLDSPLPKNMNRIVWIGNARPVKQLEHYLDLSEIFSTEEFEFHIIGKLPDTPYGKDLSNRIESAGRIVYHGSKDNEFINTFLMKSALLVNTSSSEGFSNTFIQSWMCGTPVLALNSDPGGVMRTFGIGIDCNGDFHNMPRALERLLANELDYGNICEKAIKTANILFAVDGNMIKLNRVLENALAKRD